MNNSGKFKEILSTGFYCIILLKRLLCLRIHWRLSTILETSNKGMWSNVFWYVKVCIFWNCIQYTIHWDKTNIKKFGQNKRHKKCRHFSFASSNSSDFTFILRFLYELKHKVGLSNHLSGISHFWFNFVTIKGYIFGQQNAWTLWLWNIIIPVKIKIIEQPHSILLPDLWSLSCSKNF